MIDRARRVSIVICAYTEDRWAEMLAAIDSVRGQTMPPHEIILVIDHNPQLFARAREQLPDVTVIENRQLRGLSGARNSGIAIASGDVIAFMDEDATAAPDWLEWLTCYYDRSEVLGVGGTIEPVWLTGRPAWFPVEFDWVVGCTYRGLPETTSGVRNLIGCNMSLRREVFQQIGGFRSGIGRVGVRPIGCEETELCIRLNQHQPQGTLLYEPRARVYHRVPPIRSSAGDGLSAERTYALQTLPRGAARGVWAAVRRGDVAGLARAGAIVSGLLVTTLGFVSGKVRQALPARSSDEVQDRTASGVIQ
jgi:GT2 family glycosyltransferase